MTETVTENYVTESQMKTAIRDAVAGIESTINGIASSLDKRAEERTEQLVAARVALLETRIGDVDQRTKSDILRLEDRLDSKLDAMDKKQDKKMSDMEDKIDNSNNILSRIEGLMEQNSETLLWMRQSMDETHRKADVNEIQIAKIQNDQAAIYTDIHGHPDKPEMTSVFKLLTEMYNKTSDGLTMMADVSRRVADIEDRETMIDKVRGYVAKVQSVAQPAVSTLWGKTGLLLGLLLALLFALVVAPEDVELKEQITEAIKSILGGNP